VIATASAKDHDFLGELGASKVIDYTHERFEEKVQDVDDRLADYLHDPIHGSPDRHQQ
jgi:NADPH:quinone reductase-like Zn-dependent oxidoreductase